MAHVIDQMIDIYNYLADIKTRKEYMESCKIKGITQSDDFISEFVVFMGHGPVKRHLSLVS